MIPRDQALPLLKPLATPTLDAFAEARQVAEAGQKAMSAARSACPPPVRNVMDGVALWALFASALGRTYGEVATVRAAPTKHSLSHAWIVDDRLRVQLKSDIDALDVEQLSLVAPDEDPSLVPPLIALTWQHADRTSSPKFVHLNADGPQWSLPVAALLELPSTAVAPPVARALVTSKRDTAEDAAQGERGRDDS
jgi:hypothetical protein